MQRLRDGEIELRDFASEVRASAPPQPWHASALSALSALSTLSALSALTALSAQTAQLAP